MHEDIGLNFAAALRSFLRQDPDIIMVGEMRDFETAEIAVKAFELSQTLTEKWLNADYRAKHQLLEIVCLNFSLEDVTLVPTIRKPFDVLAKGLVSENSRGDWI